jgi:hypothetical protein
MKVPDASGFAAADGPFDEFDEAVLHGLRDIFQAVDPMPADLPDRIRFSLALRDLEVEVARLTAEEDRPVLAARGEEQSRTITFDSDSLTIMIRIDRNNDDSVRLDGWLAPPQRSTIELRVAANSLTATADERGRFAFGRVPRGSAQLVVQPADQGPAGSGPTVVTPVLIL